MICSQDLKLTGFNHDYFDHIRVSRWSPKLAVGNTFLEFIGPGFSSITLFLQDLSNELILAAKFGYSTKASIVATINGNNYLILINQPQNYYLVKSCAVDSNDYTESARFIQPEFADLL